MALVLIIYKKGYIYIIYKNINNFFYGPVWSIFSCGPVLIRFTFEIIEIIYENGKFLNLVLVKEVKIGILLNNN